MGLQVGKRTLETQSLGRIARIGAAALGCLALANCSTSPKFARSTDESKYSPRVVAEGEEVPKGGGNYRVGKPYVIAGKTYYPTEDPRYRSEGVASWYGPDFHGRLTANGEVYDMHSISAAHPTMPMPSYARVTNLGNGRSIIVRVNDRGPYARDRVIDLSIGAAKALDYYGDGLARVRVEYVGRAPLEGTDDRMLMATLRQGAPAPAPSQVMVASAKPFMPDFGDTGVRETGSTPLPAERPFTLGAPSGRAVAQTSTTTRGDPGAANRLQTRSVVKLPSPPAEKVLESLPPVTASPVVAIAPTRQEGALGLMSGRGLY
jgi:rare lipoprotein A